MPLWTSPNTGVQRSPRPSRVKCGPRKRSNRRIGVPVAASALHRHFRAGLDRYEPVTGLNDHPEVVAFHRLVFTTPSLAGRFTRYMLEDEEALAGALGSGIEARLRAAQVLPVQRVLARTNWQKIPS